MALATINTIPHATVDGVGLGASGSTSAPATGCNHLALDGASIRGGSAHTAFPMGSPTLGSPSTNSSI